MVDTAVYGRPSGAPTALARLGAPMGGSMRGSLMALRLLNIEPSRVSGRRARSPRTHSRADDGRLKYVDAFGSRPFRASGFKIANRVAIGQGIECQAS